MTPSAKLKFAFEVKGSDLLGRVGEIKVGGKKIETPCLLPVVHPVSQAVSTAELREMGFEGVMTNSYIISSRKHDEAVRRGVHALVGFDGVIMTDSGGYQVLEYGALDVEYGGVAEFQSEIGSEMAVTLDRPTGYPQPREYAKETMEYSLKNAVATLKEYGDRDTTWVGPVQGGLYLDLVAKSAASLTKAGFGFLALGSPVQVMENYMFEDLAKMILAARRSIPYSVPLHLFGAGHPLTMALAVALGCDTFDSASYIKFARAGRYMSHVGVMTLASMKTLPCSCRACSRTSVRELLELEHVERSRMLAIHNLSMLRDEVELCKEAIAEGRLWDLVEQRSMAHPRVWDAFVELSKHGSLLTDGTRVLKDRGLFVRSVHDLGRPELLHAERMLKRVGRRNSKEAALSQAGPVFDAGSDGKRVGPVGRDVYRVHPALGVYPSELDFVYPFTQTVASQGALPENNLRAAKAKLKDFGYDRVSVEPDMKSGGSNVEPTNRQSRRGASPSPRSSSSRPRSPRRP